MTTQPLSGSREPRETGLRERPQGRRALRDIEQVSPYDNASTARDDDGRDDQHPRAPLAHGCRSGRSFAYGAHDVATIHRWYLGHVLRGGAHAPPAASPLPLTHCHPVDSALSTPHAAIRLPPAESATPPPTADPGATTPGSRAATFCTGHPLRRSQVSRQAAAKQRRARPAASALVICCPAAGWRHVNEPREARRAAACVQVCAAWWGSV